ARGILEPLENHLRPECLGELAAASVGRSYESYWWNGHLWASPIDAVAPVSSWRPDLMARSGIALPETFEEVLELAKRGLVAVPATPVDSLMHFFMICCALGEEPFVSAGSVVSRETGVAALRKLRTLVDCCARECLDRNPIQTYREMVTGDRTLYCPFAYGYSNYSRPGFAPRVLRFGNLVTMGGARMLRSTLGGAGLAISRRCANLPLAAPYLEFVSSAIASAGCIWIAADNPGIERPGKMSGSISRRTVFLHLHSKRWTTPTCGHDMTGIFGFKMTQGRWCMNFSSRVEIARK
ncbi:MAG: hypothetical protein DMG57_38185, partial [Acidobacteria bacterium]